MHRPREGPPDAPLGSTRHVSAPRDRRAGLTSGTRKSEGFAGVTHSRGLRRSVHRTAEAAGSVHRRRPRNTVRGERGGAASPHGRRPCSDTNPSLQRGREPRGQVPRGADAAGRGRGARIRPLRMASVCRAQGRVEHVLPCASDERSDCHRAVRARHRRAGSGRGSCQAVTEGTLQSTESQTVRLPRPLPLPNLSQISPAVRDGDPVTFVHTTRGPGPNSVQSSLHNQWSKT